MPMLVEAARYGDENAYRELIARTYKSVKSYCSVMGSPSESDDLAQEAYSRAIKGKTPILETENPEAFMIAISKFVCADYLKSKSKTKSLNEKLRISSSEVDSTPETDTDLPLLNELSSAHKQVVLLVVVFGFSYEESAEILSLPIGTVRSRLNRAKEILRNLSENGTFIEQLATS